MAIEIYDFSDYRLYLKARIYSGGRARRGELKRLAEAIPCQTSYLSRVMSNQADLSLEQGDAVGKQLGLSQDENSYFILLVQHARAGTPSLQAHFKKAMTSVQQERLNIQNRVGVKKVLRPDQQSVYYSIWYYAAVRILTGIPAFQTKEAIAQELGLPLSRITEIVDFLLSMGLIKEGSEGKYSIGDVSLHLNQSSPLTIRNHTNWRNQAVRSMEKDLDAGIHYTVLFNVSKNDADVLRRMVANFVVDFMKTIHTSEEKNEEMHCLTLDFFKPKA